MRVIHTRSLGLIINREYSKPQISKPRNSRDACTYILVPNKTKFVHSAPNLCFYFSHITNGQEKHFETRLSHVINAWSMYETNDIVRVTK